MYKSWCVWKFLWTHRLCVCEALLRSVKLNWENCLVSSCTSELCNLLHISWSTVYKFLSKVLKIMTASCRFYPQCCSGQLLPNHVGPRPSPVHPRPHLMMDALRPPSPKCNMPHAHLLCTSASCIWSAAYVNLVHLRWLELVERRICTSAMLRRQWKHLFSSQARWTGIGRVPVAC